MYYFQLEIQEPLHLWGNSNIDQQKEKNPKYIFGNFIYKNMLQVKK